MKTFAQLVDEKFRLLSYNENHDELGRFAEGESTTSGMKGNQQEDSHGTWKTSEGFIAQPFDRKTTLGSEVVWRDDNGVEHHGQLGFHDVTTTKMGSDIRSEKTGKTYVREVRVEHSIDAKTGRKVRTLVPIVAGEKDEDILDKRRMVLMPTDKLRQVKKGFVHPDHR